MNEEIVNILHLDFVNKIDEVIFDSLFSSGRGYFNLKSINAIENYQSYLDNFDNEVQKIINELNKSSILSDKIENEDEIIDSKQKYFKKMLDNHLNSQVHIWAQDVFNDTIENILFKVSLNKNVPEIREKLYSKAISAISWISSLEKLDEQDQKATTEYFNKRYIAAIRSDFGEYIPKQNSLTTDADKYISLIKMYRFDKDEFIKYNLDEETEKFSINDLNYLKTLQKNALQYKNILFDDEIDLFFSAVEVLNLKNNKEKIEFLTQLKCDFQNSKKKNENCSEKEKIELAKRRIEIFRETKENTASKKTLSGLKYFKKALLAKNTIS